MNIIRNKWLFLTFSLILIGVSIYGLIAYGLQKGIDFTGGTLWQVKFVDQQVSQNDLATFAQTDLKLTDATVIQQDNDAGFNIRAKEINEVDHQKYLQLMTAKFGTVTELSFQTIGSAIGAELVNKALWALGINLLAISLYIAYAFRKVSYPVSSWKYAFITLITLFHDALIPVGLMAFLGHFLGVEIDTNFIVAVLMVIGFSVHDTIVVFDRIRENLRKAGSAKLNFGDLVNTSIHETFARSVNTSLTLFIVLIALLVLGAGSLHYFILTILVGTIIGTYSSIFVASPLLVLWNRNLAKGK
ncbi:MAG: protein translocase subunit SecF [bacterium]|nr:protein translocase subunit SecF [bacterium]